MDDMLRELQVTEAMVILGIELWAACMFNNA
jgi:hypothetical protein